MVHTHESVPFFLLSCHSLLLLAIFVLLHTHSHHRPQISNATKSKLQNTSHVYAIGHIRLKIRLLWATTVHIWCCLWFVLMHTGAGEFGFFSDAKPLSLAVFPFSKVDTISVCKCDCCWDKTCFESNFIFHPPINSSSHNKILRNVCQMT